jgi:hypothetical protein
VLAHKIDPSVKIVNGTIWVRYDLSNSQTPYHKVTVLLNCALPYDLRLAETYDIVDGLAGPLREQLCRICHKPVIVKSDTMVVSLLMPCKATCIPDFVTPGRISKQDDWSDGSVPVTLSENVLPRELREAEVGNGPDYSKVHFPSAHPPTGVD